VHVGGIGRVNKCGGGGIGAMARDQMKLGKVERLYLDIQREKNAVKFTSPQ